MHAPGATSVGTKGFVSAHRINESVTASIERRLLTWMAERAPGWLTSDQLTAVGFFAQIAAGICYAESGAHRETLVLVSVCIVVNWFGDSLDGTLARVRSQQRPRYGFYVDHIVDVLGAVALMGGLAVSSLLHWQVAAAMLIAFLLLASECYLATYTLSRFQLSQGLFGPTEIRLLLIAGNVALLRSPYITILGHRMLLFDLGGSIAAMCMALLFLLLVMRHTSQLYREEPLP